MDSQSKDNACVVCFHNINIYAVGCCDHYDRVCFICSARLRVLCQKNECPICRKVLPRVIFSEHKIPFEALSKMKYDLMDRKYKISFESEKVEEEYRLLFQHKCSVCTEPTILQSFGHLKDHMRKEHTLFYCELCTENLKLFTFERRCYNRRELAQHRREGDSDNKSHRGHPSCQFCDKRYLDKDELFRHLRKDHFYCHFCDSDENYQYYGEYSYLRNHFQKEHYLCEEDDCRYEQFTSVFRSEIDMKAHVASHHSKNLTKQQAKQARTLELEFTIRPRQYNGITRPQNYDGRGNRQGRRGGRGGSQDMRSNRGPEDYNEEFSENRFYDMPVATNPKNEINTESEMEFPTLGGSRDGNFGNTASRAATAKPYKNVFSFSNELDFPSLEPTSQTPSNKSNYLVKKNPHTSSKATLANRLHLKIDNDNKRQVSIKVSSQSNHTDRHSTEAEETDGNWVTTKYVKSANPEEDFPSLGVGLKTSVRSSCTSTVTIPITGSSAWSKKGNGDNEKKNKESENFEVVLTKAQKKKKSSTNDPVYKSLPNTTKEATRFTTKGNGMTVLAKHNVKSHEISSKSMDGHQIAEEKLKEPVLQSNCFEELDKLSPDSPPATTTNQTKKSQKNLAADDFPPLANPPERKVQSPPAPPGFSSKKITKPEPPPGFSVSSNTKSPICISLSSVASQLTKPTSETKASIPHKSSDNKNFYPYIEPACFEDRNRLLIQEIWAVLDEDQDRFQNFKTWSGRFRQDQTSATEYYNECLSIFGRSSFLRVLPELLVLLPDIGKQQELLAVHNKSCKVSGALPKNATFMICASCQQVLSNSDFKCHMNKHEFSTQAVDLSSTWGGNKL